MAHAAPHRGALERRAMAHTERHLHYFFIFDLVSRAVDAVSGHAHGLVHVELARSVGILHFSVHALSMRSI